MAAATWGVVGYRHFNDAARFDAELASLVTTLGTPARIVSGGATGADALARKWAQARNIPLTEHLPAQYSSWALLARNSRIVEDSDVIVAFLSAASVGTRDTLRKAKAAKKRVVIIDVDAPKN